MRIRGFRAAWRGSVLLLLLLAACLDGFVRKRFFGLRPGSAGAVWVHRWCRRIVGVLGLGCSITGALPLDDAGAGSMAVVSNHLSYLDILVYSAARPFLMVAKSEVRGWPLIGWITAQAGTVYVERADVNGGRTQTHDEVNRLMAEAFESSLPVLFFPEGTTSAGGSVLPFRRGLFHSVLAAQAPVLTAAVAYTLDDPEPGYSVADHVCFVGEALFAPHLFGFLGLRGVRAHLTFGEQRVPGEDRFSLASHAQQEVTKLYESLGCTSVLGIDSGRETLGQPVCATCCRRAVLLTLPAGRGVR